MLNSIFVLSPFLNLLPRVVTISGIVRMQIPRSNGPVDLSTFAAHFDGAATEDPEEGATEADATAAEPISDTIASRLGTGISSER